MAQGASGAVLSLDSAKLCHRGILATRPFCTNGCANERRYSLVNHLSRATPPNGVRLNCGAEQE
jgi:hypothetical protein